MEPLTFQVTVDATDPHTQARFWADALGWTMEDHDAFVQEMLGAGIAASDDVIEFEGRKCWRTVAAIRYPEDPVRAETGSGLGRRMLFQHVPEPKQVKNRWHVDVNVGRDHIDETVTRLRGLGASALYAVDEPGAFHTTMADPEGNEFCVQ
jgi:predicted enzyme related to lactoylglutathione lyase